MTRLLYLEDPARSYDREFSASVVKRGDGYVVLDQTLFYPTGGGQEHDEGILRYPGGESRVVNVEKKGIVKHFLDPMLPDGVTHVHGFLDWERRYRLMRMHTAQHLVSGVVYERFGGSRTVGNQLHPERSHIDFRPLKIGHETMLELEKNLNGILGQNVPVRIVNELRAKLEKRVPPERVNLDLIPKELRELRVVEIGAFDVCPCAGTHVRNTSEIGRLRFVDRTSKGAETVRVEYELEDPAGAPPG